MASTTIGKNYRYETRFSLQDKILYIKGGDDPFSSAFSADGQAALGKCYFEGKGVTQDYKEAVKWYRKSADQGSADGQILLGWCYANGTGVSKDKKLAMMWFEKAAESGFPEFTNYTWTSFYVRSDTPDAITNKLEEALQTVIATPIAKEYADQVLVELMPLKADKMRQYQLEEIARFAKIAKEAGLKPK